MHVALEDMDFGVSSKLNFALGFGWFSISTIIVVVFMKMAILLQTCIAI